MKDSAVKSKENTHWNKQIMSEAEIAVGRLCWVQHVQRIARQQLGMDGQAVRE